jgi:hypothetical protein
VSWSPPSWRQLLILFSLGGVFLAGIGFGQALDDRPNLSGTQTYVRTLNPLPITQLPTETVTVTTSNP